MPAGTCLRLCWRPFRLPLSRPLRTARGLIAGKRGWLLRMENPSGGLGWGEAAPLDGGLEPLAAAIDALGPLPKRQQIERELPALPPTLGFALGAALAELDGLPRRRWLPAPSPALLLPAGAEAPARLEAALAASDGAGPRPAPGTLPFTCKWKVATGADGLERRLLEDLLGLLPAAARLRLDANGGWDRRTAAAWAIRLEDEPRLEWIEQPLAPADAEGLADLRRQFPRLPLALDESLRGQPGLRQRWSGWQVRRPSQEGDPRPLLADLERGTPLLMLSTAFETGIGRRWLDHLAALQAEGPTPAAPGLAPGWQGAGELGSTDPERVWRAAGLAAGAWGEPIDMEGCP